MGFWEAGEGHWHVGYYEKKHDFEAIGFENEEGTWDVFFDKIEGEEADRLFDASYGRDEDFGVLLFKVKDYEEGKMRFQDWVETVLLPFLQTT